VAFQENSSQEDLVNIVVLSEDFIKDRTCIDSSRSEQETRIKPAHLSTSSPNKKPQQLSELLKENSVAENETVPDTMTQL